MQRVRSDDASRRGRPTGQIQFPNGRHSIEASLVVEHERREVQAHSSQGYFLIGFGLI